MCPGIPVSSSAGETLSKSLYPESRFPPHIMRILIKYPTGLLNEAEGKPCANVGLPHEQDRRSLPSGSLSIYNRDEIQC